MMQGETITSGGADTCTDCGITPKLGVYVSGAGYYIGTYCNCGPYSRESGYYRTHAAAEADMDDFIPRDDSFVGGL